MHKIIAHMYLYSSFKHSTWIILNAKVICMVRYSLLACTGKHVMENDVMEGHAGLVVF